MSQFSGVVKIADLDDFITPSQECVKPLASKEKTGAVGSVEVRRGRKFGAEKKKADPVSVSLNDCLACSGCVTTAEAVLIQQQSHKKLLALLSPDSPDSSSSKIVITVSPQSLASISVHFDLSMQTAALKLRSFFMSRGAALVLDSNFGRNFSIMAAQKEFIARWRNNKSGKRLPPLLASICPGFVCYAEKTHGPLLVPLLSRVKSPQAICGSLVKSLVAKSLRNAESSYSSIQVRFIYSTKETPTTKRTIIDVYPKDVYHVSIMPCFDKKLEASRPEFEIEGSKEVDCTISSGELLKLLEESEVDLAQIEVTELPTISTNRVLDELSSTFTALSSHSGTGSGGYAEHVFLHAASELFGTNLDTVQYHVLRNKDLSEIRLEKDGEVVLRMAVLNGFRNIQNLVQKIRRGNSPYDYIEVMACPSGCLNGGGQLPSATRAEREATLEKVSSLYQSLDKTPPGTSPEFQHISQSWIGSLESEDANKLLFTDFYALENDIMKQGIAW